MRWQQIKEIFYAALDLPESERTEFVREKCAGDESLKAEIEKLLGWHEEAGDFIETPEFAVKTLVTNVETPSLVGKDIGVYRIEKEIGRGGMGAVYLASRADKQFEKRVAIKLIKRGLDTDEIIRRFRNERQILAALEHPNIARLLDGGASFDGLPFLVMDYIEGSPLNQYCKEKQLSINERLKLFLQICSAVEYAHRNLIIHRDLKPSNILVNSDGVPKLLDFGIAKLTAANSSGQTLGNTLTAFQAMTPEYASPEQVNGEIVTTASDIYSLGVILYELLTGTRPFRVKNKNAEQISKIITDSQPLKPSSVLRMNIDSENPKSEIPNPKSLRGDLDNIILMAMRKEPERRYSSVEQFAGDIRRYLEGLPVIAQEDTFAYRAEKFVKRNKAGVATGFGVFVSLIAGVAAISRQATIARRQRDKALAEAEKAEKTNRFLQKMLASVDPEAQGKDVKVIEILGEAAESIETVFKGQPEIIADLSTTIGSTYLSLGFYDLAETHLKNALEIRLELFSHNTVEVALSRNNFAKLLQIKGDLNSAEPLYRESLVTLRRLQKNEEIAEVLQNFGYLLSLKGRNREAIDIYTEELEIRRTIFGENHPSVAKTLGYLANVLVIIGEREKAESFNRQAIAILRKSYTESHPEIMQALSWLAATVQWRDKTEAEKIYYKVLELRRKYLGENHPNVAWTLYNLAFLNVERGSFAEAEQLARETLKMRGVSLNELHPIVSSSLLVLGRSLLGQNKPAAAKPFFEECLELREKTLSENHWLVATASNFLGECLMELGESEKGKHLLFKGYENLKEKLGENHELTRLALSKIKKFY